MELRSDDRTSPLPAPEPGQVILLNGASSSGKSTLARALQARLPLPFMSISIDHLRAAGMLPMERIESGDFDWRSLRPAFFEGFHRSLPALASGGNHLLVEHVIETEGWMGHLADLMADLDVFFVGVHCPLPELERREAARGDRRIGEARIDFETIHRFARYDLEVDTREGLDLNVDRVISAWQARTPPGAIATLRTAAQHRESE